MSRVVVLGGGGGGIIGEKPNKKGTCMARGHCQIIHGKKRSLRIRHPISKALIVKPSQTLVTILHLSIPKKSKITGTFERKRTK